MKNRISAVIICLNAASTLQKAIESLQGLTGDIVVADSGSTDGTIELVNNTGAALLQLSWTGYGANKNAAGMQAQYDWILSLDADEYIENEFVYFVEQVDLSNPQLQYQFRRLNFLGDKPIRYGEWSKDKVVRLFNRTVTAWDDSPVHEQLMPDHPANIVRTNAVICHRTAPDISTYRIKIDRYARLMAEKYFAQRKKINPLKIYLSPAINFLQNYFFRLGILDGREGFQIAAAHAGYTYNKYRLLQELYQQQRERNR